MCKIKTEILINANPQKVWEVLTDFNSFPTWNSFFKKITGEVKQGNVLKITIAPPNGKPMDFSPTLLVVNHEKELRWRGSWLSSFLFQGEHYFLLEKISDNETRFIHGENFTGLLTPIFNLLGLSKNTKLGFKDFNKSFKQHVESMT